MPGIHIVAMLLLPTFSRDISQLPKYEFTAMKLSRKKLEHYGIPGCGVFKGGIQNQKGFWLKINYIQMKLPNFENWSNGELSKSTKI